MNWKTELALMGGLSVAAYVILTNDKIRSLFTKTIGDITQGVIETGGGLVEETVGGAFKGGEKVGDLLGIHKAGEYLGATQQAANQAAYSAGEYLGAQTQNVSSMLYGWGYGLGQATQSAISWAGSVLFPQAAPLTDQEIIRAAITPALSMANQSTAITAAQSYYAGGPAPSYGASNLSSQAEAAPSLPSVESYMATQVGVGSDVYSAAAASNLGTKYAGWEKLMLVSGGVVPKPGFDWMGGLPNKTEWAQYQAWLAAF